MEPNELGNKSTILIVDDSRELNHVYAEVLESEGYRVLTAESGQKGLEIVNEAAGPIDLILLDCFMPAMNGEEFITNLQRSNPKALEKTTIVGFSCLSEEAPQAKQLRSMIDGFVEKPSSFEGILELVRSHLPGGAGATGPSASVVG